MLCCGRFLQVGGHASDGIDFQVCVFAAAKLFGCFEGCQGVFCEVAEEGESVQSGGGEEMGFANGMLSPAKLAEKSLVGGEARVEVGAVFCELPTLSFEFEMMGYEGPIERWHPVGNEVVFLDPSLVIGVVRGELNGCEAVDIVVRMPVAEGKLR